MINSQPVVVESKEEGSISKGMGDQFSAIAMRVNDGDQYIKGDG